MAWTRMGVLLLVLGAGAACEPELGSEPEVATVMLHFPGNDTVFIDVESGNIESGPIAIVVDTDFSAQFFAPSGQPDERVTEAGYRLDVAPVDSNIVTFTRSTAFAGTLHRVSAGDTYIVFALHNIEGARDEFIHSVPVTVY